MRAQPVRAQPATRVEAPSRQSDRALRRRRAGAADRARLERRRREQHWRRLRRDLLEDAGIAVVLMLLTLLVTAGLGVIALLEIPVGGVVLASFILERTRRRRRR